jgi:hypothetical protein
MLKFNVEHLDNLPNQGTFVLLTAPDRIPPHLCLLHNNQVWSLSVRGVSVRSAMQWLQLMKHKQLDWVGFGWKPERDFSDEEVKHVFDGFGKVNEKVSCLLPIRKLISSHHPAAAECNTWPALVEMLLAQGVEFDVFSNTQRQSYVLPQYNYSDVLQYIRSIP